VNWLAVPETPNTRPWYELRPDRRARWPKVYATASKNLKRETKPPFAPYFGWHTARVRIAYATLAGPTSVLLSSSVHSIIFDGVHVHLLLNFSYRQHVFSFVLVRGKEPGLSYSLSF
jgi:hypothetical protein